MGDAEMEQCMLQRLRYNRSYRRFSTKAVSEQQLQALIQAVRLTPSAANLQQLRFVPVCNEACERVFPHLKWAGYLPEWDGPAEHERPTGYMILLCPKGASSKFFVGVDAGICAQSLLLTANEMGLGGCIFGSVDRAALMDALGLDQEIWEVALVIALGEPVEQVEIVPVTENHMKYYRDEAGVHYVPKRTAQELTVHHK